MLQAIIPMKPLADSMTRIADAISVSRRKALALSMLDQVIRSVLDSTFYIYDKKEELSCTVFGGDEFIRAVAVHRGARWEQDAVSGLNPILSLAMKKAFKEGFSAALILPGDLPMIRAEDIQEIISASAGMSLPVGVPAAKDGGTNALLIPSTWAIEPSYGVKSFLQHKAKFEAKGTTIKSMHLEGVQFDLDTIEDLAWATNNIHDLKAQIEFWMAQIERSPDSIEWHLQKIS